MVSSLVQRVAARAKEGGVSPRLMQLVRDLEAHLKEAQTKSSRANTREEINEVWDMVSLASRLDRVANEMERLKNGLHRKLQRLDAEAVKTKSKTFNLSPDDLELYSKPGARRAAKAISGALNKAAKDLIRKLDKIKDGYEDEFHAGKVERIIVDVFGKHIDPVLEEYADLGAQDSEPVRHLQRRLVGIAKGYLGVDPFWSEIGDNL